MSCATPCRAHLCRATRTSRCDGRSATSRVASPTLRKPGRSPVEEAEKTPPGSLRVSLPPQRGLMQCQPGEGDAGNCAARLALQPATAIFRVSVCSSASSAVACTAASTRRGAVVGEGPTAHTGHGHCRNSYMSIAPKAFGTARSRACERTSRSCPDRSTSRISAMDARPRRTSYATLTPAAVAAIAASRSRHCWMTISSMPCGK